LFCFLPQVLTTEPRMALNLLCSSG
jgi:hypothetical protein